MTESKGPGSKQPPDSSAEDKGSEPLAPAFENGKTKSSGRVAFDARGNPTWEWEMQTGVYGRDINTARLKKLEANLTILETSSGHAAKPPANKPATGAPASKAAKTKPRPIELASTAGRNPYDSAAPIRARPAATPAPLSARRPLSPAAEPELNEVRGPLGWLSNLLKTLFGRR